MVSQFHGKQFRGAMRERRIQKREEALERNVLIGQLSPEETRAMALRFLEVAEAAEQDRIVFTMMVRDIGLPVETAAGFVHKMRDER